GADPPQTTAKRAGNRLAAHLPRSGLDPQGGRPHLGDARGPYHRERPLPSDHRRAPPRPHAGAHRGVTGVVVGAEDGDLTFFSAKEEKMQRATFLFLAVILMTGVMLPPDAVQAQDDA